MKYQLTSAKPTKVAAKVFDLNAAVEALTESLDKLPGSYEALVAAEQLVTDAECALADCQTAMESISKYGLTAQNMALLNGAEHGLDRALGLEDLSIESIASLSDATKKMLQQQYTAGLEGKTEEIFKGFVERAKAFFAKLIQWLKDFFTGNAQIIKIVQELAKGDIKELDGEKKITAYSKAEVDEMIKSLGDIVGKLNELVGGKEVDFGEITIPEKKADTVSKLGWSADALKEAAGKFEAAAKNSGFNTIWNKIQAQYKAAIAAGGDDQAKVDEIKSKFKSWVAAQKGTAQYGKLLRAAGLTIMTVSKAAKKAAEPAK